MIVKYAKKRKLHNNIIYTAITVFLLCAVFLSMVSFFYIEAENDAYDILHMQTKQIKDDVQLQILSDRENLATMANFAAKLNRDGESYDILFDSFKPIGLIENIGILNSDGSFVTKAGSLNLNGKISFEEEKEKGAYISGRIKDLTRENYEIIRTAVPIKSGDETIGILYGVIKLDVIGKRYNKMAEELNAQLFIYEKNSKDLIVDTIHDTLGNISFLKDRKYNKNYSYEEMMSQENGFTSFVSAYTSENLYMHYSALEELDWEIMLARYESQVFAATHRISRILFTAFLVMVMVMTLYMLLIMSDEKAKTAVTRCASEVRKTLLEITQHEDNISQALKQVAIFAKSRSAMFFDTDGEDFKYTTPGYEDSVLTGTDRKYIMAEIIRYAAELRNLSDATVGVMRIRANEKLARKNPEFYNFLSAHSIEEISFAAVTNKNNHITVLCVINPTKSKEARLLAENITVCLSIALYNKKHLNKTELAATTDSLTGAQNRVAYKSDLYKFDNEKPENFSCIFIDVNELHLRNNKYGHAAGDEMLIYIANTLKEVFYGHNIYRMGGDEFLVFTAGLDTDEVKKCISLLIERIQPMDYHVAIGMSFRTQNTDAEEMVREAEIRMYEAKAQYYQNKEEQRSVLKSEDLGYIQLKTGIAEIDTMLSVLKEHYNGIYRVSLDTDKARRILMPAYLGYNEDEEHYSTLLTKYIDDLVHPDYHRALMSFLNYDAIKRHFSDGKIPRITYKKTNGDSVVLSVYRLNVTDDNLSDTLWVFAKE